MIDIKYKNPYMPHKILEHFKAPGVKGVKQFAILKIIAHRYAINVMTSALTHAEASMQFKSCYSKSIGYVLGPLFFTETDIEGIEQDAIQSFTSKMGYNQNMAYVIREGPYNYGGAAIMSIVDIQGIK
eukprot:11380066-Ditylum_brightwellii.AAC.1